MRAVLIVRAVRCLFHIKVFVFYESPDYFYNLFLLLVHYFQYVATVGLDAGRLITWELNFKCSIIISALASHISIYLCPKAVKLPTFYQ